MIRKTFKYFIIFFMTILSISIILSKIIFEKRFALKTKDLKGLENLTSKVFTLTTHNNDQGELLMNHHFLIEGINFIPKILLDNKLVEHFFYVYQTAMNHFKLDGYLCGGHSRYLQRIFLKHGIKSFTYNHGLNGKRFTHMLVVAEFNDELYIFDPTYNYVYRDNTKYLSFKEVIDLVSKNEDLEKFIKIINPEDKVYNMGLKRHENFTSSKIVKIFNREKHLMDEDKNHLLLNGFGIYAGNEDTTDYFFKKYPYLNNLFTG